MYQSLSDYWQFIKRPKLLPFSKNKPQLRRDFITLLILNYAIAFFVMGLLSILLHYKLVKEYPFIDLIKQYGLLGAGFFICIAAPLIEESIFRYQLRKRTLSIYFIAISIGSILSSNISDDIKKLISFTAFILLAILADNRFRALPKVRSYLLWQRLYGIFFYFTAIIFAYVHLSNTKGLSIADPSFIFYILSQLAGGISLGYMRLKYGLIYSILFHACYNGFIFLIMIFSNN